GRCLVQPNMLPFETPSIFDQLPRFVFKMPRVVPDQKAKFESDELFRRLSRECEVDDGGISKEIEFTRFVVRPFLDFLRELHVRRAFVATGTNLQLVFSPCHNGYVDCCDFDKEHGKVHIKSSFIMNGVCVRYRGWIDLDRLDGVGCLEYDEERG
ncbi:protein big brother, putative, partial [Ixodes scapularis]